MVLFPKVSLVCATKSQFQPAPQSKFSEICWTVTLTPEVSTESIGNLAIEQPIPYKQRDTAVEIA
jgi:hypothetical protein